MGHFGPFAFHALNEMAKKGHSTTFVNLISRTNVLFKPIFTQRKSKMILECLGPPFTKSLKSAIFANFSLNRNISQLIQVFSFAVFSMDTNKGNY